MLIRQVALVSETDRISASALTRVGAALQRQVQRDLAPIWQITAAVSAFASLDDVPVGYWPIIISEQDLGDAAGIHEDQQGQPFALVRYDRGWALTASHECLEMLVDPFGNRLIPGPSPMKGQGRVEFLVEVCDPSEDTPFAYHVNGVAVSDFYTPHYFDPVAAPAVRYSFTGAIKGPRQVLQNGYLSWHDPVTDHWFQMVFFGNAPSFRDLGKQTAKAGKNLRRLLYDATPERHRVMKMTDKGERAARLSMQAHGESAGAKAEALRRQIRNIVRQANKGGTNKSSDGNSKG
jgi:hypothetical protein